ncbi:MAG: RNA 2',3'-cyclic phosphodiesterase [Oscillospiraceae bacterium]|nr:RNA 2',3'-cyclic phosphodiesterase [Oscillospiraceae bacterium]
MKVFRYARNAEGWEHFTRLFIAISLSEGMKDALVRAQDALYDSGVRGNFTPEENLHLTLAFIGEYPDAGRVLEALSRVSFTPFELCLEGAGCFGDLFWIGMRRSAPLDALARKVRHALAEGGVPFDRKRFSPHITLIRRVSGKLPVVVPERVSMRVESFSLLRSDRGKGGMIYTTLGTIPASGTEEKHDHDTPVL